MTDCPLSATYSGIFAALNQFQKSAQIFALCNLIGADDEKIADNLSVVMGVVERYVRSPEKVRGQLERLRRLY